MGHNGYVNKSYNKFLKPLHRKHRDHRFDLNQRMQVFVKPYNQVKQHRHGPLYKYKIRQQHNQGYDEMSLLKKVNPLMKYNFLKPKRRNTYMNSR